MRKSSNRKFLGLFHLSHSRRVSSIAVVIMEENDHEPMALDNDEDVEMIGDKDDVEDDDSDYEDIEDGEETAEPNSTSAETDPGAEKKKKSKKVKRSTYLPGMQMQEGETLVCEESAYITLHTFTTTSPCLSFDIIPDNLGHGRNKFPLTAYSVSGTQAQRSHANNLLVMKVNSSTYYSRTMNQFYLRVLESELNT